MSLLSAEAIAIACRPESVSIRRFSSKDDWLAMRERDVTASVAGALWGLHPYVTAYGLWSLKTGRANDTVDDRPAIDETTITFPPAARGHLFERPTIEAVRMKHPEWAVSYPLNRYWTHQSRIGATPDALAIDPRRPGFGVIQVKTVSAMVFSRDWIDHDTRTVVPPTWILLQAMIEARLTGASWAAVAALVSDWTTQVHVIDVPILSGTWAELERRVAAFWSVVASGEAPDPDYGRDAKLIAINYRGDDPEPLDARDHPELLALVGRRRSLKAVESQGSAAEKKRKTLDAEIVHRMGNHSRVVMPDGAVIVVRSQTRETIDEKAAREKLGPEWCSKHSKKTTFNVITEKGTRA